MAEEHEQPSNSEPKQQQENLCEECSANPSKYKCPGCSLRTCSLPCVNSHKHRTGCTGKRRVTDVVPISEFDDNLLLSDYNMLEDVKRMADAAKRMRVGLCGCSNPKLPYPLKGLKNAAASRRTKLLFHSLGMSKRAANRTYYNHRNKFISWTIEWRFHSTRVVLIDHGVNENRTLSSVIENHLKPGPWNHSLKKFCDEALDSLKLFIRKYPKGQKSPFRQLNIKAPIREQLANIVILEYPVIHVFLPSEGYDFEVINDIPPRKDKVEIKEPVHSDYPSPRGVTFREEEIEDGECEEPYVSDLMNETYQNVESNKEPKELVHSPSVPDDKRTDSSVPLKDICVQSAEDSNIDHGLCPPPPADISWTNFSSDPGLVNGYWDIIEEVDPNSNFGSDGVVTEVKDMDIGDFLLEEELEEGEIID